MDEPVQTADVESLWLLVVKGNYKHRIAKTGIETPSENRIDCQQRLCDAASSAMQVGPTFDGRLGRPAWASGAMVFVTLAHSQTVQAIMKDRKLMSKHIIVSDVLRGALDEALKIEPPTSMEKREQFWWWICGGIKTQERIAVTPPEAHTFNDVYNSLKTLCAAIAWETSPVDSVRKETKPEETFDPWAAGSTTKLPNQSCLTRREAGIHAAESAALPANPPAPDVWNGDGHTNQDAWKPWRNSSGNHTWSNSSRPSWGRSSWGTWKSPQKTWHDATWKQTQWSNGGSSRIQSGDWPRRRHRGKYSHG